MSADPNRTVELRLRAAVESAPSGLLMVDADGRIVLVNREIERLFGYSREELLGRSVDLLVPEGARAGHAQDRAEFLSRPSVRAMGMGRDLFGRRKDGTLVPLEIGLTPVATEEGMFVLSSVVDISARRKSEARFRAAVESSPAGMVMVEEDGRIVLVNREVERMFGYDREELLGESVERLVPERFRKTHPGHRRAYFGNPVTRAMGAGRELYGLRKDGTEIPIEIGLNPIETDEGLWILSSIVDISARKEEERARAALEAQLRQAQKMEAVGTLAGGIAHDFNNILGAITGYAELLQTAIQDPRTRSDVDEVLHFALRGKELVQRILAFSRREESSTRQPVSLPLVVDEVLGLLRSSLGPQIRVLSRVDPRTPAIQADRVALHQVLMNLGMNGAQAMPEGGEVLFIVEPLYVTDSVARAHPELREGPHVSVSVRDSGVGMEPDVKARAFEPFFTTKGPGRGTGLGLAIVHGIVAEHGGAVELESEPGQGTVVRCILPAADPTPAEESKELRDVPRGNGERILLLDDEPRLAEVGARRLASIGYRTHVESDARAALERLESEPAGFDLVVTDYLMPGMTGIEFAASARALRPDLPIVLLTGNADRIPAAEITAAGIDLLLRKPVTLRELAEGLQTVLSPGDPHAPGGSPT